jgi:WD40 repeat protein
MARYDRVLIDPSPQQLEQALQEAVTAANERRRQRLVSWPLPGLAGALGEAAGKDQGWRQWNGGDGRGRSGDSRSIVVLAWWSDLIGRKHHRVVGRQGHFNRPMLDNLLCPFGEPRPALWFVYPDYVFLKRAGERRVAFALCACGSFGTPDELGWMGPRCDACHDLGEDGRTAFPAWPDPKRATLHGQEGRLLFLAYAPDGRTLAAGTGWEHITLWDTASGEVRGTLGVESDPWLLGAAWSDDGQTLVTCSTSGRVRLWDVASGQEKSAFDVAGTAACFALAPDGGLIARADRQRASVYALADGSQRDLQEGAGPVSSLAFAPGGSCLAGGSQEGTVCVWDVSTGEVRSRLERRGDQVTGVSFAPDGSTLAVGLVPGEETRERGAGPLLLWEPATGQARALPGHAPGTRSVSFAPDGRVLATGGDDGLLKLWDVALGRERVAVEWHLDGVCAVAFAPDGLTVASGSFDGSVKLWPREVLRPLARQGAREDVVL